MDGSADLRVSDQERERAVGELREHFAAGRLTEPELNERVQAAYAARTQQELHTCVADLPALPLSSQEVKAEMAQRRRHLQRRLLQESGGAATPFAICTLIWLASGADAPFWPIWVAIPLILMIVRNGWRLYGPSPELDRVQDYLEGRGRGGTRDERRAELRAERHERRTQRRR